MKQFSFVGSCEKTKNAFYYLLSDYKFDLIMCSEVNYGFTLEYKKMEVRVYLYYDYRDNIFNFYLVRGSKTKVPNDLDFENIKFLYDLFKKYDKALDFDSFQPNEEGYELALNNNAKMLKKYGDKVLMGLEWI